MPSTRRAVLATALATCAGCIAPSTDTPTDGDGPTDTDGSPTVSSPSSGPPPEAPEYAVWTRETAADTLGLVALGGGPESPVIFAASATGGGRATDEHTLQALSLQAGDEQWRLDLADPVRSPPTYLNVGEGAYAFATGREDADGDGYVVHAIDPTARQRLWRFSPDEPRFCYPIAVDDDRVYVGQRDDQFRTDGEFVSALDATDGTTQWRTETGDVTRTDHALRGGILLVDSARQLQALAPADGDVRWRVPAESQAYDNRGERVFVEQDSTVRGLTIADGSEVWRRAFDVPVSRITSPRQAMAGTVYVADTRGRLLALNPLDGSTRWTLSVDDDQFHPTVERTSERLYVGGAGVHAVDPVSGERQWDFTPDVGGFMDVHPGAPDTVFATSDRHVWALDPSSGETRWAFEPGRDIAGVATAGESAWVGVGDTVYALDGRHSA